MKSTLKRTIVSLTTAGVALSVAVAASTAQASPSDHVGDPELWGRPWRRWTIRRCRRRRATTSSTTPTMGAAAVLEGSDGPDLILGNGGNDHHAGAVDDVRTVRVRRAARAGRQRRAVR